MALKKFKPSSPDRALGKIQGDTEFARLGHLNRLVDDINNTPAPTPEPVIDDEGNLIVADSSTDTIDVGPGGTHLIPNFSGMLIVNDHYDGGVETWIAGGGDTICLGATNTGGGPVGSSLTISGSGYLWQNDSDMNGPFTFTVIKTRNTA